MMPQHKATARFHGCSWLHRIVARGIMTPRRIIAHPATPTTVRAVAVLRVRVHPVRAPLAAAHHVPAHLVVRSHGKGDL